MRILQLCHDYRGPFVSVCRQYVAALSRHEVITVFLQGEPSESVAEQVGGHEVLFLEASDGLDGLKWSLTRRLQKLIPEDDVAVILAHRFKAIHVAALLNLAMMRSVPVIGVAHEFGLLRRWHRRVLVRLLGSRLQLLGVSTAVCNEMIGSGFDALPLPHGIDPDEQHYHSRAKARATLKLPDDGWIVGTIGRLVKKKNQQLAIQAFARLADKGGLLVFIGDGPEAASLRELAEALDISDQVVFAGHIDGASRLVTAFDGFLLTSDHREAFGMVLLEAMLGGVPVVTSDAPGPLEVVAGHGLTFASGDAQGLVDQLACLRTMSHEARHQMAAGAIDHVRLQHSPDLFARQLADIIGQQL